HELRRQFLAAAVVAACTGLVSAEKKESAADFRIVDTHQHLWDLSRFRLPWLRGAPRLNRSYLPQDYQQATRDLPGKIVQAVYMEVDVAPEQQQAEADYIIELCKQRTGPTVAAVISGRPASDGFKNYITQFKHNPLVKGVRQVL